MTHRGTLVFAERQQLSSSPRKVCCTACGLEVLRVHAAGVSVSLGVVVMYMEEVIDVMDQQKLQILREDGKDRGTPVLMAILGCCVLSAMMRGGCCSED